MICNLEMCDEELVRVIRQGNLDAFRTLLKDRNDYLKSSLKKISSNKSHSENIINLPLLAKEVEGQTLHYLAAVSGQINILDEIINNGANLSQQNSSPDPDTGLYLIPLLGAIKNHKQDVLRYLITIRKQSPEMVLVTKPDDLHIFKQVSVLEYAVRVGNIEAIDFLLSLNVDPATIPRFMIGGSKELVSQITTVLHNLVCTNNVLGLQTLNDRAIKLKPDQTINFKVADQARNTLLHVSPSREMTEYLVARDLAVNELNKSGDAPIHLAIANHQDNDIGTLEVLALKADLGLKSKNRHSYSVGSDISPLVLASLLGKPNMLRILLKAGADIKHNSHDPLSPLRAAVTKAGGNKSKFESVEILLRAGVDPNASNFEGKTPLIMALEEYDVNLIRLLLEYGADSNIKGKSNALRHLFLDRYAFFQYVGNDNQKDLLRAQILQLLVEYGTNVDQFTPEELNTIAKESPIAYQDLATSLALSKLCESKDIPLIHELLIKHPFLVKSRLPNGDTLVHYTLRLAKVTPDNKQLISLLKLLITDITLRQAKNEENQTPLQFAKQNGLKSYAKLLASPLEWQLNQAIFNHPDLVTILHDLLSGIATMHGNTPIPEEFSFFIQALTAKGKSNNLSELLRDDFIKKFEAIHSFIEPTECVLDEKTIEQLYSLVDTAHDVYQERQEAKLLPTRVLSKRQSIMLLHALNNLNQVMINHIQVPTKDEKHEQSQWKLEPLARKRAAEESATTSKPKQPKEIEQFAVSPFILLSKKSKREKDLDERSLETVSQLEK